MGILDDAIREHLELKRKHGVPEEELQRQEEEALGPARREVASAEAQDGNGTSEAAEVEAAADGPVDHDDLEHAQPERAEHEHAQHEHAQHEHAQHEHTDLEHAEPEHAQPEHAQPERVEPDASGPAAVIARGPVPLEEQDGAAGDTPPSGFAAVQDESLRDHDTPGGDEEALQHDEALPEGEPPRHDEPLPHDDALRNDDALEEHEPHREAQPAPPADPDLLEDTPDFLQETPEHDRLWFEQKPPRDFDFD